MIVGSLGNFFRLDVQDHQLGRPNLLRSRARYSDILSSENGMHEVFCGMPMPDYATIISSKQMWLSNAHLQASVVSPAEPNKAEMWASRSLPER